MALYKVGNRYLSEDEYQSHCENNWILALFIAGAIAAGVLVSEAVPAEWPRYLRFSAVVVCALVAGSFFGGVAHYIRKAIFWLIGVAVLAGISFWVWGMV